MAQPSIVNLYKPAETSLLESYVNGIGVNHIVAQTMYNRGIKDLTAARFYVNASSTKIGQWEGNEQVENASRRIMNAIINKEKIVIYGDFDADGVTSTRIAVLILEALGATVEPYIPSRIDEGYGLNTAAIDYLRLKRGAKLIVTVDCGIRSIEEAAYCNAVKTHLIVTDHHNFGDDIPDAFAVINPKDKRYTYGDSMLAGAGVSFRFFEYLYHYMVKIAPLSNKPKIGWDNLRSQAIQLAMIGTVADLVPLQHLYNRVIVKEGLKMAAENPLIGLEALIRASGLKSLKSTDIAFGIAPRINAAGRLDNAMIAYDAFAALYTEEADKIANALNILNGQRQDFTKGAYAEAMDILAKDKNKSPYINFIYHNIRGGILGLVAGKISGETNTPTVVMSSDGAVAHASARSIQGVNITAALEECKEYLISFGGHDQAAGLNIAVENIPAFREKLEDTISKMVDVSKMVPSFDVDAEIGIDNINTNLCNQLEVLEPVGNGNSQAVFISRNVQVLEQKVIGSEGTHYRISCATGGAPIAGVFFGGVSKIGSISGRVDIIHTVEINDFRGNKTPQMNIKDISAYYAIIQK